MSSNDDRLSFDNLERELMRARTEYSNPPYYTASTNPIAYPWSTLKRTPKVYPEKIQITFTIPVRVTCTITGDFNNLPDTMTGTIHGVYPNGMQVQQDNVEVGTGQGSMYSAQGDLDLSAVPIGMFRDIEFSLIDPVAEKEFTMDEIMRVWSLTEVSDFLTEVKKLQNEMLGEHIKQQVKF